jgi:hypothetical protein
MSSKRDYNTNGPFSFHRLRPANESAALVLPLHPVPSTSRICSISRSEDMSTVICRDCARVVRQNLEGIIHQSIFALVRSSKSCPFCAYLLDGIGDEDLELLFASAKAGRYLPVAIRKGKLAYDQPSEVNRVDRYELTVARVPRGRSKRYEMDICTNRGMSTLWLDLYQFEQGRCSTGQYGTATGR